MSTTLLDYLAHLPVDLSAFRADGVVTRQGIPPSGGFLRRADPTRPDSRFLNRTIHGQGRVMVPDQTVTEAVSIFTRRRHEPLLNREGVD